MSDPTTAAATAIPFLAEMVHLDTYADCQQVLASPKVCEVDPLETYSAELWHGTLPIINNEPHLARRRYLAPIFSRGTARRYDEELLDRAIVEVLESTQAADDGICEVELIGLVKLMLIRIAAAYIGIDGIMGDAQRAQELIDCVGVWTVGTQARYTTRPKDEVVREGLEALEHFQRAFFAPSQERRAALVERHLAGELDADDLPLDVITFQLLPRGAGLWDDATAVRDTLPMLAGGLHTTASSIARCVEQYLDWRERDGEPGLEDDPDLTRGLVNETLRLFPPVAYIVRKAVDDLELRSGRVLHAGDEIALLIADANRDPAVYGEDADAFRPRRYTELPPQYPQYGLSFGAGPHLCIGRPLVTAGGVDSRETRMPRVMNRIIAALLVEGVDRPVHGRPTKEPSYRDILKTYPVVLSHRGLRSLP